MTNRNTADISTNTWKPHHVVDEKIKNSLRKNTSNSSILAFIQILNNLKTFKRTGWLDHNIPFEDVESISDHMYRMSIISMIIPNTSIDISKCVKISVIHDIAESLVGDITPFGGVSKQEKHRRELESIQYLSSLIEPYNPQFSKEIISLWLEYEEISTPEARYIKDIDKFEMIQQAWDYEQKFELKYDLSEFYSARSAIKTKEIGDLADEVINLRNEFVQKLKNEQKE